MDREEKYCKWCGEVVFEGGKYANFCDSSHYNKWRREIGDEKAARDKQRFGKRLADGFRFMRGD